MLCIAELAFSPRRLHFCLSETGKQIDMQISSNQAQTIIDSAETKARQLGLPVVIAVLDNSGHLKAFRRMDGAVLGSIDIATRKATTAVLFQCNSEDVWEYCKPGAPAP